mgnify:CR=1 FL=1
MKYEEKILLYLVENYRKSKKDSGANKTNRRTQVKPEKLYKKYNANDGDFEEISKYDVIITSYALIRRDIEELKKSGAFEKIQKLFILI